MRSETVVGRGRELAALHAFLDDGRGALVLEGEPGIGKTTLWQAGLEAASRRNVHVLAARPAEAETALGYATVSDLLEPVLGDATRTMPLPQRRALDVALGRGDRDGSSDGRIVAAAVLTALRALAEERPVVVAVDDVQWVDGASAQAVSYAVRRLAPAGVSVLATRRTGIAGGLPLVEGARVPVDALGPDELARIVHAQLGLEPHRSAVLRLAERSGGNPFFALELARDGRVLEDPDAPLPRSLDALLRERIGAAPRDVRDALLVAASHPAPSTELLARAGVAAASVEGAVERDLLSPAGDRLRFTHPLIASAVLARTTAARRREVHARLAAALEDADERALHLALATRDPDENVAASVEGAAGRTARRGAAGAAAEMAAHAVRLTPAEQGGEARRRALAHARFVEAAGDATRARALLQRLAAETPAGPERARALVDLALCCDDLEEHFRHCEAALAEADERGRARALLVLAVGHWAAGDLAGCERVVRRALPLVEASAEEETLAWALYLRGWTHWWGGNGVPEELFARAQALVPPLELRSIDGSNPERTLAPMLVVTGEFERARAIFEKYLALASDVGNDWVRADLLSWLAQLEARAGHAARAGLLADEAVDLGRQLRQGHLLGRTLFGRARVRAFAGRLDEARADAEEALAVADELGLKLMRTIALDALGYVALTLGQLDVAADHLQDVLDLVHALPWREPATLDAHHHLAEVYVLRGQLERAESVLDELEAGGRPLHRTRSNAGALRVRGLIAGARGDMARAEELLRESLAVQARRPEPHESGRTLIHLGSLLRRAGGKRDAREALEEAVRTLDACGSVVWADRARAELARISGRPLRTGAMTETEQQIARRVAAGESNLDVARALSLSPKTVEWNLSKIYRKLGVRSRTELAAKLARRQAV